MLSEIKAGKKYIDADGDEIEVLFVGKVFAVYIDGDLEHHIPVSTAILYWKELPKEKQYVYLWRYTNNTGTHITNTFHKSLTDLVFAHGAWDITRLAWSKTELTEDEQ